MPKFHFCMSFNTVLLTACLIFCFQSVRAEENELDLRIFYYFHTGNSCLSKDHCDCAIFNFNKALKLNPRFVKAYYSRAGAWIIITEFDRAIDDCPKALEIGPNCIKSYNNRGVAWIRKGDSGRAITNFDLALKINPQDVDVMNILSSPIISMQSSRTQALL